jgi:hypothetical protein
VEMQPNWVFKPANETHSGVRLFDCHIEIIFHEPAIEI